MSAQHTVEKLVAQAADRPLTTDALRVLLLRAYQDGYVDARLRALESQFNAWREREIAESAEPGRVQ